jgi:small subunit ribosomal protein S16
MILNINIINFLKIEVLIMVIIRLSRGGTNKRPFYHVVVTNSRSARDGRYIERLGFYNPIAKGSEIKLQLHKERIDFWISNGAQLSERVAHLLKNFAEIAAATKSENTDTSST